MKVDQMLVDRVADALRKSYYQSPEHTLQTSSHKAQWRRMAMDAIAEVRRVERSGMESGGD